MAPGSAGGRPRLREVHAEDRKDPAHLPAPPDIERSRARPVNSLHDDRAEPKQWSPSLLAAASLAGSAFAGAAQMLSAGRTGAVHPLVNRDSWPCPCLR